MQAYCGTQQAVQNAGNTIYFNMLKIRSAQHNGTLYSNPPNPQKANFSDLSESEVLQTPYLGFKKGSLNIHSGFTTCWGQVLQREDDPTKYWTPKPDDSSFLVGVTGVIEETFDNSWIPEVADPTQYT
jgi:hypothetical protein